MTDEKYAFIETMKERKDISHGARHVTSKRSRKGCKLPSDYLSAKERKNMDSAVVSVKKGVPITANEFKWLSEDGKREYLSGMARCGFDEKQIAEKTGIGVEVVHRLMDQYHITVETIVETISEAKVIPEDLHPISYSEFKDLSQVDQVFWMNSIRDRYHPTDTMLAALWNVSGWTIHNVRVRLGIPVKDQSEITDADGWKNFCGGSEIKERHAEEKEDKMDELKMKEMEAIKEETPVYSSLLRLQVTLEVHSWEELYNCLKGMPFPEAPLEIRTISPMRYQPERNYISYDQIGKEENEDAGESE